MANVLSQHLESFTHLLLSVPGFRRTAHVCNWRTFQVIFATLLLVVTFHVFSQHQFEFTDSVARLWISAIYRHTRCNDVIRQMRNGKWQPRRDLRPGDELHRREQDIRIRKLRGLPITLHREDMQCGNMFPIDVPDFGAVIPSLCDPFSSSPCCNHMSGTCGSDVWHCACDRCTDFRNTVVAELNEFVPSSGCQFKNFTSKQTCQLLSKRVSSVELIGDSLVRHFHNALMILFTDDKETGCLVKDIDETHRKLCSGDIQFVDGGKVACHDKTAKNISQLPPGKFCLGKQDFEYSFHEFYSMKYAELALSKVRAKLNKTNSVIALGVGLHMGLDANKVFTGFLKPMVQLKEQSASKWPLIVWLTTHAHGSLKPIAYLESQGNEKISRFNRDMREFLEPVGIPVFDTFNLTLGVHSYDGTHYGFGVNMMKAQLFMNFLDETFQQKGS